MPPRLVGVLLSEGVVLDAFSNRLSVVNMLETVNAPVYPAMIPRLFVTTVYENDPPEQHLFFERARVLTAAGQEIAAPTAPTVVKMAPEVDVHNSVYILPVKLQEPAKYSVVIEQANGPNGPWAEVAKRLLTAKMG